MTVTEPSIPGFFTMDQMELLARLVRDAQPETSVEIGSFMGRSTYAICDALRDSGGSRRLVCVDSWPQNMGASYFDTPAMKRLFKRFPDVDARYRTAAGNTSVMDMFNLTLERHPFMRDYVEVRNVDSRDVDLSDLSIDFAFLDAAHTFEGVHNDLLKTLEGSAEGTVIAFHDYADRYPGVIRVVDACLDSAAEKIEHVGSTVAVRVVDQQALTSDLSSLDAA